MNLLSQNNLRRMKHRKPACVFFYVDRDLGKCVLKETENGIQKFDIYTPRTDEWRLSFLGLPRCPFIQQSEDNRASNTSCSSCAKRLRFQQEQKEELDASRLEDRGF